MKTKNKPKFDLGQVVSTPNALEALHRNDSTGIEYLHRHASGDWGIVCEEDKQANETALKTGARLLSAYFLPDETKLWIITDAAVSCEAQATYTKNTEHSSGEPARRPVTTLLLPEEY